MAEPVLLPDAFMLGQNIPWPDLPWGPPGGGIRVSETSELGQVCFPENDSACFAKKHNDAGLSSRDRTNECCGAAGRDSFV
jgi:hypothetical protein